MANNILNAVWDRSTAKGSSLLIMLVLADSANKDTGIAWPAVRTIAKKARVSQRSVQRICREREVSRELAIFERSGRSNIYVILIDQTEESWKAAVKKISKLGGDISVRGDIFDGGETVMPGGSDITVTPEPLLTHTNPKKQSAKKMPTKTWMTEYGEIWTRHYGGKMPFSKFAKDLKEVENRIEHERAIKAWDNYCLKTPGSYASAAKFQQTIGEWDGSKENKIDPKTEKVISNAVNWMMYIGTRKREEELRKMVSNACDRYGVSMVERALEKMNQHPVPSLKEFWKYVKQ